MVKRKYSAVVFDLGNVLIPFDYKIMLDKLDAVKAGLGKKFWEFYMANYSVHRTFERGGITNKEFIRLMLESCENRIDETTFCKYYSEIFRIDEDVVSLLPIIKHNGYKLFLLSNTNDIHRIFGYKEYYFLKYFDKLFLSYQVGAVKPEPEIYKSVENFSGFAPEEHLFIDDIADYAEGAKNVGWDAIHFKDYNQLINELKMREIL